MKVAVNNPLLAVAILSRYSWLNVSAEYSRGDTDNFCATGVILRKSGTLQFNRQFAIPRITADAVEDVIPVSNSKFMFLTGDGTVYTVEAINKALANYDTASGSKEDPSSLIDWSRSNIDSSGNMLIVLDLRKLGNISGVEYSKIKSYMNVFLGGLSIKNQVCRTIYFEVVNNGQITVGLFNLETEQKMTAVPVDLEISYAKNEAEKIRHMLEVAREELEAIPQF